MSKADTLLKKATFFERMALYSDRKAFLKSLGQATDDWGSPRLPADILQGLDSLLKDLSATKPESSVPMQNKLMAFYQGMNTDLGQLAQAVSEAANMIPGDHTTQVQNALALAEKVRQLAAKGQPQQQQQAGGDETVTFSPDKIKAYPPIDRASQKAVFDFATKGVGKVDGSLGPETRAALTKIKNYYKQQYPNNPVMSDQQAIQAAKFNAGKPLP